MMNIIICSTSSLHQDDVCAQGTARKLPDGGEDADLEVHRTVLEETGRGERRAAGARWVLVA